VRVTSMPPVTKAHAGTHSVSVIAAMPGQASATVA
jgi:hypothetical protein